MNEPQAREAVGTVGERRAYARAALEDTVVEVEVLSARGTWHGRIEDVSAGGLRAVLEEGALISEGEEVQLTFTLEKWHCEVQGECLGGEGDRRRFRFTPVPERLYQLISEFVVLEVLRQSM